MKDKKQEHLFSRIIALRSSPGGPVAIDPKTGQVVSNVRPVALESALGVGEEAVLGAEASSPDPAPNSGQVLDRRWLEELDEAFVWVAPGMFVMGSPPQEPGRNDDETEHAVTLSRGFYLQRVPVTQGLWQAVLGNNPAAFAGVSADLPVENVSWQDCQAFIAQLNALTGCRHRLPTEAEWEYACRAGSSTALALGALEHLYCDPDPVLDELAWYCANAERRPHAVGGKAANAWGLQDTHGNLWEWCADWYGPYPELSQLDPSGPPSGRKKVVRGGSWFSAARNCRCAARFSWDPLKSCDMIGLRLVREAEPPAAPLASPADHAETLAAPKQQGQVEDGLRPTAVAEERAGEKSAMGFRALPEIAPADAAFEAWGDSLEHLFAAAAEAVLAVMVERPEGIENRLRRPFSCAAEALDLLLFEFLRLIVYYKDAESLLLRPRELRFEQPDGEFHLDGVLAGETFDALRHPPLMDVKAVTLHQLEVAPTAEGWRAVVVLDL